MTSFPRSIKSSRDDYHSRSHQIGSSHSLWRGRVSRLLKNSVKMIDNSVKKIDRVINSNRGVLSSASVQPPNQSPVLLLREAFMTFRASIDALNNGQSDPAGSGYTPPSDNEEKKTPPSEPPLPFTVNQFNQRKQKVVSEGNNVIIKKLEGDLSKIKVCNNRLNLKLDLVNLKLDDVEAGTELKHIDQELQHLKNGLNELSGENERSGEIINLENGLNELSKKINNLRKHSNSKCLTTEIEQKLKCVNFESKSEWELEVKRRIEDKLPVISKQIARLENELADKREINIKTRQN